MNEKIVFDSQRRLLAIHVHNTALPVIPMTSGGVRRVIGDGILSILSYLL